MTTAKELLKQRYYEPIKEQPELFVGIELEYPVVNLSGNATDVSLTKQLLVYLLDNFDFQADKYDSDNNPIQLIDKASGDMILFEVSYNTIEFAFAKAERISEVEERLDTYFGIIQPYLQNHNHELQGWGVNPNWAKNDNRPVKSPRYEMLMDFLELSKAKNDSFFHDYPEYGSFICGSQVQLDVSKTSYLRVLNAFNQIEGPKEVLLANSEFWGSDWDLAIHVMFSGRIPCMVCLRKMLVYFLRCLRAKMTIFLTCLRQPFLLLSVVTKPTILNQYVLKTT